MTGRRDEDFAKHCRERRVCQAPKSKSEKMISFTSTFPNRYEMKWEDGKRGSQDQSVKGESIEASYDEQRAGKPRARERQPSRSG